MGNAYSTLKYRRKLYKMLENLNLSDQFGHLREWGEILTIFIKQVLSRPNSGVTA
jgi:hypothetical protein